MSLLISPLGHCRESNLANEVKMEMLWEEKWSVYSTSLIHAVHFFLFYLVCVYIISPLLFLCIAIYCVIIFELIHNILFCFFVASSLTNFVLSLGILRMQRHVCLSS